MPKRDDNSDFLMDMFMQREQKRRKEEADKEKQKEERQQEAAFAAKANCTTDTQGRTNVKSTTSQVTVSTCTASGEDPLNDTLLIE